MPGMSATASASCVSCASCRPRPLRGVDREQERAVVAGAERLAQLVVGHALGLDSGWLPSSGWPRRMFVVGKAKISRTITPPAMDSRLAGHALAPAVEARGRLHVLAPLRRQPAAEHADHGRQEREGGDDDGATPIADAMPSLPISGSPMTSRPAIATITIRPAATTEEPAVAGAGRPRRGRVARGRLLAEAADDEQRVVDAGAEAEHHRDRGRELRQPERRRRARRAASGRR